MPIDIRLAQRYQGYDIDSSEAALNDIDLISVSPRSILSKLAAELAKAAQTPRNTTFLAVVGIFSSVCSNTFAVAYPDGKIQPTSLYHCSEMPPGSSKSRVTSTAQDPIFSLSLASKKKFKEKIETLDEQLESTDDKAEKKQLKKEIRQLNKQLRGVFSFVTDATPEGLDSSLSDTNGFFAIASAEQAAVNSLLGLSYKSDGKSNKDLALLGYNGDYHHSKRSGRDGFEGFVVGSLVVIAQEGTIENIIKASEDTGVVERVILWKEPHMLGKRDHLTDYQISEDILDEYFESVENLYKLISPNREYKALTRLSISGRMWQLIRELKQEFEPSLDNGGENSSKLLRGMITKIDILIMKLAAVLHLSIDIKSTLIQDDRVLEAISIARAYITHLKRNIANSAVSSLNDQDIAVISLLKERGALTGKQIADKLYRRTCFIIGDKMNRKFVQTAVESLLERDLVVISSTNASFKEARFSLPKFSR